MLLLFFLLCTMFFLSPLSVHHFLLLAFSCIFYQVHPMSSCCVYSVPPLLLLLCTVYPHCCLTGYIFLMPSCSVFLFSPVLYSFFPPVLYCFEPYTSTAILLCYRRYCNTPDFGTIFFVLLSLPRTETFYTRAKNLTLGMNYLEISLSNCFPCPQQTTALLLCDHISLALSCCVIGFLQWSLAVLPYSSSGLLLHYHIPPALSCCVTIFLQWSLAMLPYSSSGLLLCYHIPPVVSCCITIFPQCSLAVLPYSSSGLLLCYHISLVLFCNISIILQCSVSVQPYSSRASYCIMYPSSTALLQCYNIPPMPPCCVTIFLQCSLAMLPYFSNAFFLFYHFFPRLSCGVPIVPLCSIAVLRIPLVLFLCFRFFIQF
jgi:hypothetical protein